LMGRMGHASIHAALIYQHRTADRDRVIAAAIDLMLTGLDGVLRRASVLVLPSQVAMGRARRGARAPISDAYGRCLHLGEGALFPCIATLFAFGAGDGNRTRTSAWER